MWEDFNPLRQPASKDSRSCRNRRRFRDRVTVLAHSTKMKIDCPLDKLTDFFLRFPGCNTPWQIGHISAPGRRSLFVDDEILHQLLLHHQQR
jgi:hypothetical protein